MSKSKLVFAAAFIVSILLIVECHNQQWLVEFSRAFAAALLRYDKGVLTALYWGIVEVMDNYPIFGWGGV